MVRLVNQAWGALNASLNSSPRFVIQIELPSGDVYITSHGGVDTPTTPLAARLKKPPKISTQALNPDQGRATIGSMSFSALDIGGTLTAQQQTDLLTNENSWRKRKVKHWSGFDGLPFADWVLEDTQLLDGARAQRGLWTFKCRDIQREMRKKIFEPLTMHLAQPVDEAATTIEVYDTTGFLALEHGDGWTDAPNLTVAYFKIDDEIIRVASADIGATQFTNCTRGVLGTRAQAHTTDETAGSERGKKVEEVFYFELPVPKLAYALLTGVLVGQSGTLTESAHLGLSPSDIRLSDFQNIGSDLYDQTDDSAGVRERYILTKSEDGKQFIEKQLMSKYGLFMPIHSDGQIGLKRGQPVLSGSAAVGTLNDSVIMSVPAISYDMNAVINEIEVQWNEINGTPSRTAIIEDTVSKTVHQDAPKLTVQARGLTGSIHTESTIRDIYHGLRDRYSGPPIKMTIECAYAASLYEVGDPVRVVTDKVPDYTQEGTTTLDRTFEVQGVTKDPGRRVVRYKLFASSQAAGPLPPLESATTLPDSWYTSIGTDIASLPGVVDTGSELQLPDGLDLSGGATLGAGVYYATEDVSIPSGRTVTYNDNTWLRIRGNFSIIGEFNGAGRGLAGVSDTVDVSGIPGYGGTNPVSFATQPGQLGYFGTTQGDGGLIERMRQRSGSSSYYRAQIQSLPATVTQGAVEAIPSLQLAWDGSTILGLPDDLRGTSGGPGGVRYWNDTQNSLTDTNRGGTGGAGGAGLCITCRGMVFGASGRIDSSGADGSSGVRNAGDTLPAWSGGGAGGAPGATVIILDGALVSAPALTNASIIADNGATPLPVDPFNYVSDPWIEEQRTRFGDEDIEGAQVPADRVSYFESATADRQAGIAAARFFFLRPEVTPTEDVDDTDLAAEQDISLNVVEAFGNRLDPAVTIVIASITQNTVTAAYSHANIYKQGISAGAQFPAPVFVGGAEPDLEIELPADGETYNIIAYPTLINGVEAPTGEETSQVTTDGSGLGLDIINWRGPWADATGYSLNDVVEFSGRSYICVTAHTSSTGVNEPTGTTVGNTWWDLFVDSGADGADGRPGLPGASSLLNYDDLQTGTNTGGDGDYQISSNLLNDANGLSGWGDVTSNTVQSIWLRNQGSNGAEYTALLVSLSVGDNLTWYDSPGRWVTYVIVSLLGESNGAQGYEVDYLAHDETDGNGSISGASGVPVLWRLSRAPSGESVLPSYVPSTPGGNYGNMAGLTLSDVTVGGVGDDTIAVETAVSYVGTQSVSLETVGGGNDRIHLSPAITNYNTPIPPNRRWLVIAWAQGSQTSALLNAGLRDAAGTQHQGTNFAFDAVDTWQRFGWEIDLTAVSEVACNINFGCGDYDTNGDKYYIDAVSLLDVTDYPEFTEANLPRPLFIPISDGGSDGSDGSDGADGNPGQAIRAVNLYKLNDATLTDNTQGTFADPTSGMEAGWGYSVPALGSDGDIVYVISRTFTDDGLSPQDSTWDAPSIYAQRNDGIDGGAGSDGSDGADGQAIRQPSIYRLNSNAINASNGNFADPLAGNVNWSYSVPSLASDGDIVYVSTRTFTDDAQSPQDASWSTPAVYAQRVDGNDGADGADGSPGTSVTRYSQSTTATVFGVGDVDHDSDGGPINISVRGGAIGFAGASGPASSTLQLRRGTTVIASITYALSWSFESELSTWVWQGTPSIVEVYETETPGSSTYNYNTTWSAGSQAPFASGLVIESEEYK